jgi:glycosyltransferase involved in cell wall biosynthesis
MTAASAPRRLLVVSHPCVVPVNQAVYARLGPLGWDTHIVVPARWRHEYASEPFEPLPLEGLEGRLLPLRVVLPGRPQRHVYLARPARVIRSLRPEVAFVEEEGFSLPAFQWGSTLSRAGVPFGVQADENLDRPLPWVARWIRGHVLPRAAFVAARSPRAGDQARRWGATGRVALVPHAVPGWRPRPRPDRNGTFTIGFAGRLAPEKGVDDLVRAAGMLDGSTRLLFVGDGPLRAALETAATPSCAIEVRTGIGHGEMPAAYAEMDVLVLPSRTTERWAEQFGRVLVEALSCGVPVVGSDSGEIPWVVRETRGGKIYAEGDAAALAAALQELRDNSSERQTLARRGREAVQKLFSVDAAARALDAVLREVADAR